ncbi:MAG: AAA family ATPase, partial [Acidimicrobiia bacterium]|nr:AAA family ATPase [Acidimicrobiia bacterium]
LDLARLQDIQRELQRQMRPLARQAKAAEKYVELRSRIRSLRLFVGGRSLSAIRARAAEIATVRSEFASTLDRNVAELHVLGGDIAKLESETGDVSKALQRDTASAARLETTRERLDRIASVANERSRSLFAGFEQRDDRLNDLREENHRLEAELDVIAAEHEGAQSEVDRTEVALRALEDEERSLAEQEMMPAEGVIANLRGDLAALEASDQRDSAEIETTRRRILDVEAHMESNGTTVEIASAELRIADKSKLEVTARIAECRSRAQGTSSDLEASEQRKQDLQLAVATATARIEVLQGAGGVDVETREAIEGSDGVLGSLLAMLDIPDDLEIAVNAALGTWLDAYAVTSRNRLIQLVSSFDVEAMGGLTLVNRSGEHQEGMTAHVDLPGGLLRLIDVIGVPDGSRPLLMSIMGDVALADDWAVALEVARANPHIRIVTRQGDLIGPSGVQFGAGTIVGALSIEQATGEMQRAADVLQDARAQLEIARQAHEIAIQDERAANDELRDIETQRSELAMVSERASRAIESSNAEISRLNARMASLQEASVHRQSRLIDLRSRLQALEGEEAERQAIWEALTQRRNAVAARRDEARVARQTAGSKLASLQERRRMLITRSHEVTAEIDRLSRIDITSSEPERLVEIEDAAREAIGIISEHLEVLRERQRANREIAGDAGLQLETARQRRSELDRETAAAKERDGQLAIEAEGLRVRDEAVAEGLRRDVDASEDEALAAPQPDLASGVDPAMHDWQAELDEKEAELRRIGPVNPLAAEEYAALEERSTFQADQISDLESSASELRKVIQALDDTMANLFHDAYGEIARYYEENFELLFPGGRGRLRLEDPDNLLETGVVIDAQPAGKKLRRLSLLSGGERTMAAIAFLFAVFRARPSPFYVLDEVEAALDDANLRRFLRLVDALRESSQVLIITHQQQTMEVADILYGVTMEPGGSSKVIAKRLRDVSRADLEPPVASDHDVVPSSP